MKKLRIIPTHHINLMIRKSGSRPGVGRYLILVVSVLSFLLLVGAPVQAAPDCSKCGPIQNKSAFLPDCVYYEGNRASLGRDTKGNDVTCETACGCRNVNVFIQLLVKSANWFFGIVGAAALIMFIYGGFRMLTAAGNPDAVKAGKDALVAAVIGLAIIFSAQLLMRFVLEQAVPEAKLGDKPGEELQIKGSTPIQQ